MDTALFKDIPELFETDLGESLASRTESLSQFRELGPPDLCHVVKTSGRSGQRDFGSYHYITGVDASSSASLAAYINSLTYSIEDNQAWFGGGGKSWKLKNGCYCCFNAFSRVDIRVDVKIPGGVNAYVIDLRGERHEPTPDLWLETYVSAILRSILYSDDPAYYIEAWRKLDPITTLESEIRFLQAAEGLFSKGWQVGSDPEIQVATIVTNHLTAGIMKYFGNSGRYQPAANLFEKIAAREPDVASLLARAYIGMNQEVKALQILTSTIHSVASPPNTLSSLSYTLLHAQSDFLRSKNRHDLCLKLLKQAVNTAPSEFVTWEKLTECYIDLGEYENALLTLNSCPMFTFSGRDLPRLVPTPAKIHLPQKSPILEILPDRVKTDDDDADPALLRLPAPALRGTWARAYALLTRLVSKIGWDELLKIRSGVFVMEEEYRMQKAHQAMKDMDVKPHVNGKNHDDDEDDETSSTRGIPPSATSPSPPVSAIPSIKISSESDDGKEEEVLPPKEDGEMTPIEKPEPAQPPPEDSQEKEKDGVGPDEVQGETLMFSNKRLCERWLDNLFMVLYEDLRIWTIFRAEIAHFKTQHVAYRKTGLEWEILADLGVRLQHREEAKEAYQRCLDTPRYSVKPWLKLMEMYTEEGDITRVVQSAIRVAAYQWGEFGEMTYPTTISSAFFTLGQIHGHAKVQYTLQSMGLPEQIEKIMKGYLAYGAVFKVEGWDF